MTGKRDLSTSTALLAPLRRPPHLAQIHPYIHPLLDPLEPDVLMQTSCSTEKAFLGKGFQHFRFRSLLKPRPQIEEWLTRQI